MRAELFAVVLPVSSERRVPDRCRTYEVDGRPVTVRGGPPLDAEGQAALGEVVRAAEAKYRAEHPGEDPAELGARQAAAMERLRARSPALRRLQDRHRPAHG